MLWRCFPSRSKTSTVLWSSAVRNRRLPFRSNAKWSKSPENPGKGVVATNFSGCFTCALVDRAMTPIAGISPKIAISTFFTWVPSTFPFINQQRAFTAELDVEILRDAFYAVVLEHGEVQIGDARTDQDIATCIASEVEALREHGGDRSWVWIRCRGDRLEARWELVTVCVPEGHVRRRRDNKALCFDVVGWITGIRQ